MSSSKPFRPPSRGSAEAAASLSSVTTAILPNFRHPSPFADTSELNSYSEVSVRSDCDRANFQNNTSLASLDTSRNITTYRIAELEKKRTEGPLFDSRLPDFVDFHEETIQFNPNVPGSTLVWHKTSDICEVMIHGRQPSFEKHADRVVPNPWRRFGTLTKLMVVGGWSNKRKKSICFEVKPGTPLPHAPNAPQMMLHRDPKRPILFQFPAKNIPSEICAQNLASQLALRVEKSWMKKPWVNSKRLHFMDPASANYPQKPLNTSKRHEVQTCPTHTRSHLTSSGSASNDSDCSTAVTGRFSNVSISSTSTATPNIRKSKK